MQLLNIPTRVIWMNGHTVNEVWNGKKWILIDSFGNVRAKGSDNEDLGIHEVIKNYSSARFVKVLENDNNLPEQYLDNGYFASERNKYKNQNLLLTISGQDLFTFHIRTRKINNIFSSIFNYNDTSVGNAKQLIFKNYYVGNFRIGLLKRLSFD